MTHTVDAHRFAAILARLPEGTVLESDISYLSLYRGGCHVGDIKINQRAATWWNEAVGAAETTRAADEAPPSDLDLTSLVDYLLEHIHAAGPEHRPALRRLKRELQRYDARTGQRKTSEPSQDE